LQDCGDLQFAIFMCDCSLHLGDRFFEKSFFLSEFRTRCENIFLGGDNTGSRGGEGERERVPDGSNSSSDEDASDYHGSEESDGASEAQ